MALFLQTPTDPKTKLLDTIVHECAGATAGAAAFAFASAAGVRRLFGHSALDAVLAAGDFEAIIGLDAITDPGALNELKRIRDKHPTFRPRLFLHSTTGALFHPKTIWFRNPSGGIVITGSGNLTEGGLTGNWEAFSVTKLDVVAVKTLEAAWEAWVAAHQPLLVDVDDPDAIERAQANRAAKVRIKKAVKESGTDLPEEVIEAAQEDLVLHPVLIAEVPKSRKGKGGVIQWSQVNLNLESYQQFFGVTLGAERSVTLVHVRADGTFDAPEERKAVVSESQNYRFEVGAARGLTYPEQGNPIVIFVRTGESFYQYVFTVPGEPEHEIVQGYLDDNYLSINKQKKRIQVSSSELRTIWPDCPLNLL